MSNYEEIELLEDWESPTYGKAMERSMTAIGRQSGKGNYQAIVKITGFGSEVGNINNHLSYLTRNWDNELEDEQGNILVDRQEIEDVMKEWSADFTRRRSKLDEKTVSLTVTATDALSLESLYKDLKLMAVDEFNDYDCRVDKSRSKSRPHDVTIRIKAGLELHNDIAKILMESKEKYLGTKVKGVVKKPKDRLPRNVMKLMLSSPEHTDPDQLKKAVKAFSEEVFGKNGHRYLIALHDPEHDKKTEKYPHIHLIVKMKDRDGRQLSTSKEDLHRWRKLYAEKAREHGIPLEASYRSERGIGFKGERQAIRGLKKRGKKIEVNDSRMHAVIEAHKLGEYHPSAYEVKQLVTHLRERQKYSLEATFLKGLAKQEVDYKRKSELSTMASVLEKDSLDLPVPKSRVRLAIDNLDREMGTKTRIIISDKDIARIDKEVSKLHNLTHPGKSVIVKSSKEIGQEKQDGHEL